MLSQLARNKRLRTWEKYDEELEAARAAEAAAEVVEASGSSEVGHVTVTEMISPVSFWVQQPGSEKQIEEITDRLSKIVSNPQPGFSVKTGEVCVAKFSADGAWYRAAVEARKGDMCTVRFIDFGNQEDVSTADMLPLPSTVPSHQQIPAQAIEYKLAYIKVGRLPRCARRALAGVYGQACKAVGGRRRERATAPVPALWSCDLIPVCGLLPCCRVLSPDVLCVGRRRATLTSWRRPTTTWRTSWPPATGKSGRASNLRSARAVAMPLLSTRYLARM